MFVLESILKGIKMFDNLSEKLQKVLAGANSRELTQDNMQDALREIRRALLEADVNLQVVKSFISSIKDQAEGEKILEGVNPSQQLVKIVHDKLVELLGQEQKPLDLSGHPSIIMMLGLQGSGKTTSSAKLAVKLKNEGKNPLLVACDVYRPAAISQIITLGKETEIPVFTIPDCKDVQKIVHDSLSYAKENNNNVVILDTAGRLQIDTDMMAELLIIDRVFQPNEKLLVIDSMTGQDAVNSARDFDAQIGVTGLILTKLDGDSRGGAALSVVHCTGKPIKLTGTGEKLNALENFYPERMVSRILGMGDIVSLVERAQEVFDEKEALKLQEKMQSETFNYNDFLNMQNQMKMFGSMDQILGMIPGISIKQEQKEKISQVSESEFKKMEVFIQSMTPEERENPEIMNTSRKRRISAGCGIDMHNINLYVKQFEQMRQMMGGMNKMKKMFGGFNPKNKSKALVQAMNMMKKFK